MSKHFTLYILIGMLVGLGGGIVAHDSLNKAAITELAGYLGLVETRLKKLDEGVAMATFLAPGVGLHLPPPPADVAAVKADLTLKGFLSHVIPSSIIDAMAHNEVLEIVVFSLFVGAAIGGLGTRAAGVLDVLGQVAAVMLRVTEYVMTVAPLAVAAAIAATVMRSPRNSSRSSSRSTASPPP